MKLLEKKKFLVIVLALITVTVGYGSNAATNYKVLHVKIHNESSSILYVYWKEACGRNESEAICPGTSYSLTTRYNISSDNGITLPFKMCFKKSGWNKSAYVNISSTLPNSSNPNPKAAVKTTVNGYKGRFSGCFSRDTKSHLWLNINFKFGSRHDHDDVL